MINYAEHNAKFLQEIVEENLSRDNTITNENNQEERGDNYMPWKDSALQ
jgi:hypothetical protein